MNARPAATGGINYFYGSYKQTTPMNSTKLLKPDFKGQGN